MVTEKLRRLLRHLWLDAGDARRALDEAANGRLEARIAQSEATHSGQICVCVEASLPPSYLWRHLLHGEPLSEVVRDRAITLFGKQRVWDTENNNGVLIYLLLAEHRIEIVADRGLTRAIGATHWNDLVGAIGRCCRDGEDEQALRLAIEDVGACLQRHYPRSGKPPAPDAGLPNRPMIH